MNQEINFSEPSLAEAMSAISGDESVDDAVIAAAAGRVWASCFSASRRRRNFIGFEVAPDFRCLNLRFQGQALLSGDKAMLVRDHLHECVACRKVYEGRVASAPVVVMPRKAPRVAIRWAAAAAVVFTAGGATWMMMDHRGTGSGRAIIQAVNGSLFEVTPQGITPLLAGQALPDNVEIRTAKDSDAVLKLKDGSLVEMRERSGFSTDQSASDLTVRLLRGSVIVQAAKRKAGHLYVSTADCRVAVTGTIFGVSAGAKGSRVSVVQGEVHVEQNNRDSVLHSGGQMVTSPELTPETVSEDISWSRDRERYDTLLSQIKDLGARLQQIPLPGLRYSSTLLPRLPAATMLYISIPNLSAYIGDAKDVLDRKLAESPALRQWWSENGSKSADMLERLRGAEEYLGNEIALIGLKDARSPVFVAEIKRDGLAGYLKKFSKLGFAQRNGLAVIGAPETVDSVAALLDDPQAGIKNTVIYKRAMDEYAHGAGFLLVGDVAAHATGMEGVNYIIAGEKQVGKELEAHLSVGIAPNAQGPAAWLANSRPHGVARIHFGRRHRSRRLPGPRPERHHR